MRPEKLLEKLTSGSYHNVAFGDLCRLAEAFGFRLSRVRGSHHIYEHRDVPVRLNLQDWRGQAKPYQIRQLLAEGYSLTLDGRVEAKA